MFNTEQDTDDAPRLIAENALSNLKKFRDKAELKADEILSTVTGLTKTKANLEAQYLDMLLSAHPDSNDRELAPWLKNLFRYGIVLSKRSKARIAAGDGEGVSGFGVGKNNSGLTGLDDPKLVSRSFHLLFPLLSHV